MNNLPLPYLRVVDDSELWFVPPEYQTNELRAAAIRKNVKKAVIYIGKKMSVHLCMLALGIDENVIKYIHKDCLTPHMCKFAVGRDGNVLKHIPDELKTPELNEFAVSINPYALRWVSAQTQELCDAAVAANPRTIEFVDKKFRTPEMIEKLFSGAGEFIGNQKERLDKYYAENGYETIGPFKVKSECMRNYASRYYDDECTHAVILEDGSLEYMNSGSIAIMLENMDLSHEHFRQRFTRFGTIYVDMSNCDAVHGEDNIVPQACSHLVIFGDGYEPARKLKGYHIRAIIEQDGHHHPHFEILFNNKKNEPSSAETILCSEKLCTQDNTTQEISTTTAEEVSG